MAYDSPQLYTINEQKITVKHNGQVLVEGDLKLDATAKLIEVQVHKRIGGSFAARTGEVDFIGGRITMSMRALFILGLVGLLAAFPGLAASGDGIAEQGKIVKEPKYQSKPKYCLLVFGAEAKTRVWLVLDPAARVLYLDRNSNGDLTEKGERIRWDEKITDGWWVFPAGDIGANAFNRRYTNLRVLQQKSTAGKHGLSDDPGFFIAVDVKRSGFEGTSVKSFGDRPQDAPVVHFDRPLTLALDRAPQVFERGKERKLTVTIQTHGPGLGSFRRIWCNQVPADIHPIADIEFPGKDAKPIKTKVILNHRC